MTCGRSLNYGFLEFPLNTAINWNTMLYEVTNSISCWIWTAQQGMETTATRMCIEWCIKQNISMDIKLETWNRSSPFILHISLIWKIVSVAFIIQNNRFVSVVFQDPMRGSVRWRRKKNINAAVQCEWGWRLTVTVQQQWFHFVSHTYEFDEIAEIIMYLNKIILFVNLENYLQLHLP